MAWPTGTSVLFTGVVATPVAGSSGASWTLAIQGVVTLATGQTLQLNHQLAAPAGLAAALQTGAVNAAAAEGVALSWP